MARTLSNSTQAGRPRVKRKHAAVVTSDSEVEVITKKAKGGKGTATSRKKPTASVAGRAPAEKVAGVRRSDRERHKSRKQRHADGEYSDEEEESSSSSSSEGEVREGHGEGEDTGEDKGAGADEGADEGAGDGVGEEEEPDGAIVVSLRF